MTLEHVVFISAATLTGLLAGVFFGYAVSVNWALNKLKDSEYVRAMQSINIVILNPLFFLSFFGPVVLLPLAAFLARNNTDPTQFILLIAASAVYIVGSFGVTVSGNVPLNDKLAKFNVENASDQEIAEARMRFEKPWNRLHAVRTVASIVALLLVLCVPFA